MQFSTQNVRTLAAAVIALAMIGVAFWFSNPTTPRANALSTDELLRAYVEQDTDSDGLPDWQEEIYKTDPTDPHSVDAALTDAEAVKEGLVAPAFRSEEAPKQISDTEIPVPNPSEGSLTEQFSQQFIEQYLAAGGGTNVSADEQQAIIDGLIGTFAKESETLLDSSYTSVSLHVSKDLEPVAYIGTVEQTLLANLPKENSDMPELANAFIEKNDAAAGRRLKELGTAYKNLATTLLALPVPPSLSATHLSLIRSYDRVSRAGLALSRYEEDPVAALGALSIFVPAGTDIRNAFTAYADVVLKEGEPAPGAPGELSVTYARSLEQP